MPYYKGEAVSDTFMQGLCAAYREGQKQAGLENPESGDDVIIARLESTHAEQVGAAAIGLQDGGASEPTVTDAIEAAATVQAEASGTSTSTSSGARHPGMQQQRRGGGAPPSPDAEP